jgi:zinc protease
MPAQLPGALGIMADVAENPVFAPDELERARKQALDSLQVALGDPGQVAAFATAPVVYAGTPYAHAADGTPQSLKRVTKLDLEAFHSAYWRPDNAILVLTGDIAPEAGFALAERAFGGWRKPAGPLALLSTEHPEAKSRTVAIDLPGTGQAAVIVTKPAIARTDPRYYQGLVTNTVLGGGYSARLNEEIRVKRGLSYGADSRLSARRSFGALTAEAQTRNDAAPQVADLIRTTMASMASAPPMAEEIEARKFSLIGEYGRTIGTASGLARVLQSFAIYGIDPAEVKAYTAKVEAVTPAETQAFSKLMLDPANASVIVVGDAKQFAPALKAQAPDLALIPIAAFDPDTPSLRAPAAPLPPSSARQPSP